MDRKLKLYLMTNKGLSALITLISNLGSTVIHSVVCAKDAGVVEDYYREIESVCKDNGIRFIDRLDAQIKEAGIYSIAIGWRWLISNEENLIVLHDSLLPKYRGFAPLVNALLNREPCLGCTAIFANARFDEGDVIGQESIQVAYPLSIATAIEMVSKCYSILVCRIVTELTAGRDLPRIPQKNSEATYSLWLDEEDYQINWQASAEDVHQFILAVGFPFKGASSQIKDRKVRILDAAPIQGYSIARGAAGKVLFINDGCPWIVTGNGLIRVTKLIDDATRKSLLPWTSIRTRFS